MRKLMKTYKKYIALLLALTLITSAAGCAIASATNRNTSNIKAALLYNGKVESKEYLDTYSQLEHSFMANFELDKVDAGSRLFNLNQYDLIYLDKSVASMPEMRNRIVNYVEDGNSVFVPNEFSGYFGLDFFGASGKKKIDAYPDEIAYSDIPEDMQGIQEIIKDFSKVYEEYEDFDRLEKLDYGYGFIPDGAVSIADFNGISMYGINKYGEGTVFYTNPLLPNSFHINGFSMERTNDMQSRFTNSVATANQIILSEFAAYVSKMKYGYSIKKVLGSFGSPAMAWQLHYEEITGIERDAAITFGDLCKEQNTIPSYTLIRNSYKWFAKNETITYLTGNKGQYQMDLRENAYSSGTHVVENDKFLTLEEKSGGSYFTDDHSFMRTAYPYIDDINGDGIADIVSGSSDGRFYYFEGETGDKEWKVKDRWILTNMDGRELSVGAYSSPVIYDYDGDGVADIISGSEGGDIYFFRGYDATHFYDGQIIMSVPELERPMPYISDLTGDGKADMVIGSINGVLNICRLTEEGNFALTNTAVCDGETFVAPYVYDFDGDGNNDLICGTFDGYVKKLKNNGDGTFLEAGYYDIEEKNYKGNNHIKFGNNSVPRMYDVNNDGNDDLIAGELEYGFAIPIDSPYFKFRNELQRQVDYIQDNNFYLGFHFYTSEYSSSEREAEELRLHKRAFDSYAIDYDDVGGNMHTWRMSEFSPYQTLMSARDAGLKWISGFRPANTTATPDSAAEFSLVSPFFTDFDKKDFMVGNAGVLDFKYDEFSYMSAKYDLPVSQFYHCDFVYADEKGARGDVAMLAGYQKAHNYNFVREDQLFKNAAAAYNMKLKTDTDASGILSIYPAYQDRGFALYDEDYQSSTGIKIEFSESVDLSKVGVKAKVWRYDEEKRALYVGLDSRVSLNMNYAGNSDKYTKIASDKGHILMVNLPADIRIAENEVKIAFEDDGMMQVKVQGQVKDYPAGWDIEYTDGITTLTKFGSETDLYLELAD